MPSIPSPPDSFDQGDLTPPLSACDADSLGLPTINLPLSPEDSDASDTRRQVMIFSGTHFRMRV